MEVCFDCPMNINIRNGPCGLFQDYVGAFSMFIKKDISRKDSLYHLFIAF